MTTRSGRGADTPRLATTSINQPTQATNGTAPALAHALLAHGIPVVVCRPNPAWRPGAPDSVPELFQPPGWNTITAEQCDLSGYRPGVHTLAMVSGHGVDVVDVDTKAPTYGSVNNLPRFRSYGEHRTPSGGGHYFVRSTGVAKLSPFLAAGGPVGDYAGGTADGGGRMLVYLPGSARPKYAGKDYEVVRLLDLDALLASEPDGALLNVLLSQAGGRRSGGPGQAAASNLEVQQFLDDHRAPLEQPCSYGRAVVRGLLAAAPTAAGGRHGR